VRGDSGRLARSEHLELAEDPGVAVASLALAAVEARSTAHVPADRRTPAGLTSLWIFGLAVNCAQLQDFEAYWASLMPGTGGMFYGVIIARPAP
jgi:hypothetical protein